MILFRIVIGCSIAICVGACASKLPPTPAPTTLPSAVWDKKSNLALNQILPEAHLTSSTARPTQRPPIAALALYAHARDANLRGQPQAAILYLQQAILLDPFQFDLRFDLGRAYVTANNTNEKAITAFEKAEALEPNHLDLQTELGRLFLAESDLPSAIYHLRLATMTSAYPTDDGRAAVVDLFLARALKDSGYDRAALDRYTILLRRFANPSLSIQQNPELAYLLAKPDSLFIEIGELMEKHGAYSDAIKAFKPAVDHSPDDFDLQARYARDLAKAGNRNESLARAIELVVRDRATAPALAVLRDVCRDLNLHDGEVGELKKLTRSRPNDRAILYALADTLIAASRTEEARTLLQATWNGASQDIPLTRRLFFLEKDDTQKAARLLIKALCANPDALHNYFPMWEQLLRPGREHPLKISEITNLNLPPNYESARQFWIAQTAADAQRISLSRSALEKSVAQKPSFAPAYRSLLTLIWLQPDLSDSQKIDAADHLIASASDPSLQAELHGTSLVAQKKVVQATSEFSKAMDEGGRSPLLQIARAQAERGLGPDPKFEQRLWALISDQPFSEDAYTTLFSYYSNANTGSVEQAMKVLSIWLLNDPQSTSARIAQAQVDMQLFQPREAEAEIARLNADDPDSPDVFRLMGQFYTSNGRINDLIIKLEKSNRINPRDTDIVARLVSLYVTQKRNPDAARLLDSTRLSVKDNPSLLYSLSSLYAAINQKPTAEDVLQQTILLQPGFPGACNDLGFAWADEGKNLRQAENLIRQALASEPDNASFLDSLGWVLYKRGKFSEAQNYLQQAIDPSPSPDPVVLDHLGDAEYRQAKINDARNAWNKSLKNIDEAGMDRADMRQLRMQLMQKIKQANANQPVDVAPMTKEGQLSVVNSPSNRNPDALHN